ncbi:MAG: hypothetical protein DRP64_04585 [Verrucomicrobia bacterium]|nr:MAG: hypothetical protein DRP64_04585 [Verrucomicrobiota bacterium]
MIKTCISMMKTYISALLVVFLAMAQTVHAQLDAGTASTATVAESEMLSWLFEKGLAHYKAGSYDEALRMFDGMLALDKYNSRAMDYRNRSAKRMASKEVKKQGAVRSQAITDVDAAWNPEPRVFGDVDLPETVVAMDPDQQAIERMVANLKSITLPSLDFTDAYVEDVVLFLAAASRRLDGVDEDVDFAFLGMESAPGENTVSITIVDMSLYEALQFIVEMTSLKFEVKPNVVAIMPANYVPITEMVMKSYDVIPEVGTDLASAADSGGGAEDLFGDSSSSESATGPTDVSGFFSVVDFPVGSSAIYQPRFHKLFVKNTPKNLKAVEAVLDVLEEEALKLRSQQVLIETKFVEFNEGALEELGFDWDMFGSGSVASLGLDGRDVTAGAAANSTTFDPITGQPIYSDNNGRPGQNVFGSAQRDNTSAFGAAQRGLLGLMGGTPATMLFNNGDIDLQITAMEQEGSADVLSAPRVTTKSGTEAIIRIAETHRYPQDYDVETGQRTAPIVKPQDWEDFDMGVSLKVTPVVDSDSNTIDLDLYPEIMKFKGFDPYVVGFNAYDAGGNDTGPTPVVGGDGSDLIAKMASFERRTVQTQVTVADGHTIVMGGMIDERTETFRDQVPFLGDIPYLGRLFRTEGSRSAKKNLTIFVKATQIDARGMTRAERDQERQARVD